MDYNSISIKPYIKSHLELQREITLMELAPSPYFFIKSIFLAYMNMFARFDENPAMTLHDIKEIKCYGRTHTRTDRQSENSIPTTNNVCEGYKNKVCVGYAYNSGAYNSSSALHAVKLKIHPDLLNVEYPAQ